MLLHALVQLYRAIIHQHKFISDMHQAVDDKPDWNARLLQQQSSFFGARQILQKEIDSLASDPKLAFLKHGQLPGGAVAHNDKVAAARPSAVQLHLVDAQLMRWTDQRGGGLATVDLLSNLLSSHLRLC